LPRSGVYVIDSWLINGGRGGHAGDLGVVSPEITIKHIVIYGHRLCIGNFIGINFGSQRRNYLEALDFFGLRLLGGIASSSEIDFGHFSYLF
jgi:hypothetical protein